MTERVMPTYVNDGQIVYVEEGGDWIKAKVSCACGVMARVENEVRGISEKWFYLHEMRIEKATTIVDGLS